LEIAGAGIFAGQMVKLLKETDDDVNKLNPTDRACIVLSNGGGVERILWDRYHDTTSWVVSASHQQLQDCLYVT